MKYLFLFFAISLQVAAQDTIFTKTQDPLLVRVLEISKIEVSYKNFYNPDGVIYKIGNAQIVKIVYENGKQESRFQLTQKTDANPVVTLNSQQFMIEGHHISMNNKDLSYKEAFKMMLKRDAHLNSDALNDCLLNAESKKNGQLGFIIVSPICFAFILAIKPPKIIIMVSNRSLKEKRFF
jgi:hypothetical protein